MFFHGLFYKSSEFDFADKEFLFRFVQAERYDFTFFVSGPPVGIDGREIVAAPVSAV